MQLKNSTQSLKPMWRYIHDQEPRRCIRSQPNLNKEITMASTEDKKTYSPLLILQWLQLIVLAVGVAGFFTVLGSKSETLNRVSIDISELKSIVSDLVKAQISISVNDALHSEMLQDLKVRVTELERRSIR
jgi:hypothetical protein